ncbi:16S rRNA (cytosine(1402)-N(4))-methyltransferase RsmH [Candidatus Berkelbacteria bacterium]|nr:16S rRNA (cytosine(1402)-N(4))-methyltransferase RsmH [Candidatus Berkelbacteria bacterium]
MHTPVLLQEVIQYLNPKPNENFIDATVGEGGHAKAILEKIEPKGRVLGLDLDSELLEKAKENLTDFGQRVLLRQANFNTLASIVKEENFPEISGILLDLGTSSFHLDESGRGFSFRRHEPLDMRFDPSKGGQTATAFLSGAAPKQLVKLFLDNGLRQNPWPIVKRIKDGRQKTTTDLLVAIQARSPKVDAIIFQAIRIAVNQELDNLAFTLPLLLSLVKKGGKIAVISFHSGEDKIVKEFFKNTPTLKVLTKKPVMSRDEEIQNNPRASSAKMRVAEKT